MMADWKKLTVGDLCDTISDTYHRNDDEVVLVNTSDVLEGRILNHQAVENKNLKGQFKKTFRKDDILYSEIRPANKRYAYVDFEKTDHYIASTKLMVLRPKTDMVLPQFLFAFLSSKHVITELQHLAETRSGTFPQITFSSELSPIPIAVPDFETQEKIVGIMSSIEGKIQCNNAINENLSDQIQAIYSNEFDLSTHTSTGVLVDICHYSSDRIPVSELSVSTYYSTENMQPNKMGSVDATSLPSITQTTECHKGDVLVSNIRPYFKKIVYVTDNRCGCSTDVLCFIPKEDRYSAFLFGTLYMDRFFDYMVAGSKGTKMPRGDKQQIMNYPVVLPDKESLDLFNGLVVPMLDQIASNRIENSRLAALRDTLLPKLMSGELDVSSLDL